MITYDKNASDIFEGLPSPIETGRTRYDHIMEHGTAYQKESLLIVLLLMTRRKIDASMSVDASWASAVDNLHRSMVKEGRQ